VWRAAIVDGARVIEHDGRRLGYVPVFSCAGQEPLDAVADAISGPLRDCEALVLDLRGGWGGCSPDFVGLFDQAIPVLEFVARDGTRTRLDDRWRGPLVLLIDGGSRSGKELVAHAVKRNQLGLLVGQGTAGAVVGGSLFPLSDGSLLYLAVVDVYVDGVRLEGVGVAPDVSVADAPPGAGGWDPQLDEALERAGRLAREAERQRELEAESNP
jgi:carboxyl-terminal processing protease